MKNKFDIVSPGASNNEIENRLNLMNLFKNSPLGDELLYNLSLYMTRQSFMRLLFFHEIYKKIINVHGVLMEFGCKWGTNLNLLIALRGIYEPYNYNRKIIGFDTFSGLHGVSRNDGESEHIKEGFYSTSELYEEYLEKLLACMERECPISHIKKFDIIKGDVRYTLKPYLKNNPQTIIALAYLDMDLYEPTRVTLEMIKPFVTKGSIIGIDEMNWDEIPGPSIAFNEIFGIGNYKIVHSPMSTVPAYVVIE